MSLSEIHIFGGAHDDPPSLARFLTEIPVLGPEPAFVAVEWARRLFDRVRAQRADVAQRIRQQAPFLTPTEASEFSAVLGWEGDAYVPTFPRAKAVWLEDDSPDIQRRTDEDLDTIASCRAEGFVERLALKPSPEELWANKVSGTPLPGTPATREEILDRLGRQPWSKNEDPDLSRDKRWAKTIASFARQAPEGYAVVVVGWTHANPSAPERLASLLSVDGFKVLPHKLGP
jgi:hypothetical protein